MGLPKFASDLKLPNRAPHGSKRSRMEKLALLTGGASCSRTQRRYACSQPLALTRSHVFFWQSVILTFLDVVERYQASMASNIPTALHGYSSAQNYHPLATAPDSIFSVVLCAAFALTHVQAVMMLWRRKRTITRFTTEALLRRLADTLDSIAISEEHAPRRVAAVVRQLRQAWHEIITVQIPVEHNWPRSPGEELVEMPQGSQDDLAMANMFGVRAGYAVTKHWLYEHGHPMAMGAGVPLAYGESSASSSSPSFELGAGAVGSSDATVGPAEDDFWASFLGTLGGPGGF